MQKRDPRSHKGENGTVAVVGGSRRFHGAPIFAALAAEASGVDLVYPVVHAAHAVVTRAASLNFIVQTFKGESLAKKEMAEILLLLREVHAAVLGPGMAETSANEAALCTIVAKAPCALVLDARALRPSITQSIPKGRTVILTPHLGELEHLTRKSLTDVPRKKVEGLCTEIAKRHGVTVLLKGHEDFIVSPRGKKTTVKGGDAGLTKGGTGDALAGLLAGLLAQGVAPFEACVTGATIIKRAGTILSTEKGYAYTTREVIDQIPHLLRTYHSSVPT
jgi:NAD(P)H-hydrate epimerase